MNWLAKSEEQLDNLPTHDKVRDPDRWGRNNGDDYPYRRVDAWLASKVGQPFNNVISDFVHAKWIPSTYRQASRLYKHLEVNTFMEGGKVCYYDDYGSRYTKQNFNVIDQQALDTVYVHPVTKLVCIHKAPKREDWAKKNRAELAKRVRMLGDWHQLYKKDGIWYELKGRPMKEGEFAYPEVYKGPREILLEEGSWYGWQNGPRPKVKIVLKRQLNSKELRKYGLQNDPPKPEQTPCPKCGSTGLNCVRNRFPKLYGDNHERLRNFY